MSELSTDPSYGLTRRASQVAVVQSCQRAIGHCTAMMQATLVELGEDVPFDVRRYVGDEIALALSLSPWTGRDLVEEAMLVSLVPSVWGLMSDGTLSAAHARKMVGPSLSLTSEHCARVLDLVLPTIGGKTPHQLGQLVEAAVLCLDLDAAEEQREAATRRRDVQYWPSKDSQAALYATGPVEQVAAMMAALDAMTWPRQPDDDRTAAQRRFDLLVDLVTGGAQLGQWEAHIIVPIDTATGDSEELAEIPGFGKVLPSIARETIAKAGLRRLAVDSVTGQLLAVDDKVHHPEPGPSVSGFGMPVLLLAYVMSCGLRLAQGSATVAIVTTGGIVGPLVATSDFSQPQLAVVAIAISSGSIIASHVNDGGSVGDWLRRGGRRVGRAVGGPAAGLRPVRARRGRVRPGGQRNVAHATAGSGTTALDGPACPFGMVRLPLQGVFMAERVSHGSTGAGSLAA